MIAQASAAALSTPWYGTAVKGERPDEVVIARNKRASFDYELGERFEAGMVLKGSEVKMLRAGKVQLADAFCTVTHGQAFLHGVNIAAMNNAAFGHSPKDVRKLLLSHREIERLAHAISREGRTVVPTRLYFKAGWAKVELAIATGKKTHDKRETIKQRDVERELRAARAPRRPTAHRK